MTEFMYPKGEPSGTAETNYAKDAAREVAVITTENDAVELVTTLQVSNHLEPAEGWQTTGSRSYLGGAKIANDQYWVSVLLGSSNAITSEIHDSSGALVDAKFITDTTFGSTINTVSTNENTPFYFPFKDGVVFAYRAETSGGTSGSLVLYHVPGENIKIIAFITCGGYQSTPPVFYNPIYDLCTVVRNADENGGCELIHFGTTDAVDLSQTAVDEGIVNLSELPTVPSDAQVVPFALANIADSPTFSGIGIAKEHYTGAGWVYEGFFENGDVKGVGPGFSGDRIAFVVAGDDTGQVKEEKTFTGGSSRGMAGREVAFVDYDGDGTEILSYDLESDSLSSAYNYSDGTTAYDATCMTDVDGGAVFLNIYGEKTDGWDARDFVFSDGTYVRWSGDTYASGKRIPEADGFTFPDGTLPDGFYVYNAWMGGIPGEVVAMTKGLIAYPGNDYTGRNYNRTFDSSKNTLYLNEVFSEPPFAGPHLLILRTFGPEPPPPPFWTSKVNTLEEIETG